MSSHLQGLVCVGGGIYEDYPAVALLVQVELVLDAEEEDVVAGEKSAGLGGSHLGRSPSS